METRTIEQWFVSLEVQWHFFLGGGGTVCFGIESETSGVGGQLLGAGVALQCWVLKFLYKLPMPSHKLCDTYSSAEAASRSKLAK